MGKWFVGDSLADNLIKRSASTLRSSKKVEKKPLASINSLPPVLRERIIQSKWEIVLCETLDLFQKDNIQRWRSILAIVNDIDEEEYYMNRLLVAANRLFDMRLTSQFINKTDIHLCDRRVYFDGV